MADTEMPPPTRAGTRSPHRRWPVVVAAVGAGAVVVLAVGVWLVTRTHQAPPASVSGALRTYRATTTAGPSGQVSGPAPGVYTASGSGTAKLSIQASATHLGPTMPVTVTRDGSRCWWFRIEYTSAHWQSWHYCLEGSQLQDLGGDVHQRFDLGVVHYDSDVTSVCRPVDVVVRGDAQAGDTWHQTCDAGQGSGASHQAGTATSLGLAAVPVGDRSVSTYHVRWTRTTTGAQSGTSVDEYWFSTDTYMPVRHIWSLTTRTTGPGGVAVTYDEQGRWDLTTLIAQR